MPRPKSYDRQDAVKRACFAFWANGYRALGVRALEEQTGLNQFAIRTEFGGKEGLYLEALKVYSDAARSDAMRPMKEGGVAEVIAFLKSLVTEGSPTSSKWGCLVVNTGIENAQIGSSKLEAAVQDYWNSLRDHFRGALQRARDERTVDPEADVDLLSRGLVAAVMGVHTMNRVGGAHDAGAPLVELMCNHLKSLGTG